MNQYCKKCRKESMILIDSNYKQNKFHCGLCGTYKDMLKTAEELKQDRTLQRDDIVDRIRMTLNRDKMRGVT